MSIKLMAQIWESGPQNQTERFVLLALADYANDEGECWPSIGGIASKCVMSDRGIQKVLKRLEDGGWLSIEEGGGRKNCNLFTIKTPNEVHPERGSPLAKNPEPQCKNPERGSENPEPGSPEPSRTIIEPSVDTPCGSPKPKKQKRATALPEGWVPSNRNIQDAYNRNFTDKEIRNEADRFRDYHHAKGTTFKDWDAGWRTWLGNVRRFQGGRVSQPSQSRGYGQGGSLASIAAQRRASGAV